MLCWVPQALTEEHIYKKYLFLFVCVCVLCVFSAWEDQKRASDPLELAFRVVVNCLALVLRTEGAAGAFSHQPISSAPKGHTFTA